MTSPIEFSLLINPGQDTSYLEVLLRRFDANARLITIYWVDEYMELTNYATHKIGPDVSMVGNQTVSDLVAMNALRSFSPQDVAYFGGTHVFVNHIWNSIQMSEDQMPYEIPWASDPRLIFYWRDMLEKAGVAEENAFVSLEQVEETLQRLKSVGMATPLVLPARTPSLNLQAAASWRWGAGGDFLSPTGSEALLDHPAAVAGLRSFFSLHTYMPAHSHELHGEGAADYFRSRQAAVTVLDICHGHHIIQSLTPDQQALLGVAMPPGPPYQGGSSLVLWSRSYREAKALELIRYLVSPEVQREYCLHTGYLPTRQDTLSLPEFASQPYGDIYRKALENGRFFPRRRGSGLIQNTISTAFSAIWNELFTGDDKNVDQILEKKLSSVTRRIKWILQQ